LVIYQYWVLRDYGLAKATFGLVNKLLPGNSEVAAALSTVNRRDGNWNESLAWVERALALDPRNGELITTAAWSYSLLRQFPTAIKLYDRALDNIRGVQTQNANAIPVLIDSAGQLGTASSSRRFKKEIKPMDKASESIMALRPVTFHYQNDNASTPQFGLIAEEVAEVNPDLVVRDKKGEIYTVRYDAVNAMLLNEFLKEHKAFLEEQRKIQEQEVTITQLRSNAAKQEATIEGLKSTVARQQKGMDTVVAHLKEQDSKIQKVSAQIEVSKPTLRRVANHP
jgi:uncharacterized coiled-coil protein SlyX